MKLANKLNWMNFCVMHNSNRIMNIKKFTMIVINKTRVDFVALKEYSHGKIKFSNFAHKSCSIHDFTISAAAQKKNRRN